MYIALQYFYQEPALRVVARYAHPEIAWRRGQSPSLAPILDVVSALLPTDSRNRFHLGNAASAYRLDQWQSATVGPSPARHVPPATYGDNDQPVPLEKGPVVPRFHQVDKIRRVETDQEVVRAVGTAEPGDVILLAPGTYVFRGRSIPLKRPGTPQAPITLRASKLGTVRLEFQMLEGFHILAPYWSLENLVIVGTCGKDDRCEHAFHVVGKAQGTIIRNNFVKNFNSAVKVNRSRSDLPDNGLIEFNAFLNDRPRDTGNPVTSLDIVAASGWTVKGNLVADFAKAKSDQVSFGGFYKGAGSGNVFEQNLVVCEWRHRGGTRIGLSLGGGGTSPGACADGRCAVEHADGTIRNNVILNCPHDVGIYINKGSDSLISNNLLAGTRGIDVRFPESNAVIVNNILDGRIMTRDGGSAVSENNTLSLIGAMLLQPVSAELYASAACGDFRFKELGGVFKSGTAIPEAGRDLCGNPHDTMAPVVGPFDLRRADFCDPVFPSLCSSTTQ